MYSAIRGKEGHLSCRGVDLLCDFLRDFPKYSGLQCAGDATHAGAASAREFDGKPVRFFNKAVEEDPRPMKRIRAEAAFVLARTLSRARLSQRACTKSPSD